MTAVASPILATALSADEQAMVTALEQRLDHYGPANRVAESYYEGSAKIKQLKISVPPSLEALPTVIGWPGTTVDVLEERLDLQEWTQPTINDDQDPFGLAAVFSDNDIDVESSLAHLDALTYGCGFVCVGTGAQGEVSPLVTIESAKSTTGLWDTRRRRLASALTQRFNDEGEAVAATLYLEDATIWLERAGLGAPWRLVDRDDHNLGRVPVVQLVNRPRAGRRGGRSEITRAVRGYTDTAVRTLLGMETNREFYSAPQRYALGAAEDAFVDDAGNPRSKWETIMGRVWALDRDEDTDELPQVGQFPATSPGPYLEQIRGLAQLLAAEAAIPPTYLGFATDQAASADAIRAMEARLVKRAERRQSIFGKSWVEVARLALLVRDGTVPTEFAQVRAKWRDASTPTRSAAADEATKLVAAQVLPSDSTVTYDRIGLTPAEQKQLTAEKRTQGVNALLARITADEPAAAAEASDEGQAQAGEGAA